MIASTEAKFADTHARLGIVAGWGLSQRLPRLIGVNRAKELSFTGNFLSADLAYEWGLVNRVVPPEELMPTCRKLASDMLGCVPSALQTYKRMMEKGFSLSLSDGMMLEKEINGAFGRAASEEIGSRNS